MNDQLGAADGHDELAGTLTDEQRARLRAATTLSADDLAHWYHDGIDRTVQPMLNAVGHDGIVVHDMVTGPGAELFPTDLCTHQWQDDGQAARRLFGSAPRSARRSAAAPDPGDPTTVALAGGAEIARAEAAFLAQHGSELVEVNGTLRSTR
jgi:hypothetical protein